MAAIKLIQIGNSVGAIFSREMLAHLKAEKGDSLFVSEAPGAVTLTPHDPAFEAQMAAARAITRKRREVLRELAK